MSIADFGNTVQEVQQKLQEILPLVDQGLQDLEVAEKKVQEEGRLWNKKLEKVASKSEADQVEADKLDAQLAALQARINAALQKQGSEQTSATQLLADSDAAMEAATAAMTDAIDSKSDELTKAMETMAEQMETLINSAHEQRMELQAQDDAMNNKAQEFAQRINRGTEDLEKESMPELIERLGVLEQTELPGWESKATAMMESVESSSSVLTSTIQTKLQTLTMEITSIHGSLRGDNEALAATLDSDYRGLYAQASDDVLSAVATKVEREVNDFADKSLEAMRQEIVETQAVTETANLILGVTNVTTSAANAIKDTADRIANAL